MTMEKMTGVAADVRMTCGASELKTLERPQMQMTQENTKKDEFLYREGYETTKRKRTTQRHSKMAKTQWSFQGRLPGTQMGVPILSPEIAAVQ